ncbi:unnamed protein product [Lasius platythorax]|uniref:Uncharacterized protein n=1 Tax=Lasius platythorax TaxID=488582 RepID=A0AAV2MZR2_9HYME
MSIEILRKQRSHLKGKLINIKNFINKVKKDANLTPEEVTARLQALEEIHTKAHNVSQQLFILKDEPDSRDEMEDAEFDERYYSIKAELLQLLGRVKPSPAGPSSGSASSVTDDATMKQFLEQQVILMQKLTERNDNDTLVRTMEQQGQLLERLSTRSSASVREAQVKLPLIKLPTFDGNVEDWKRYADTFKTLIHDSELSGVQKHQYLVGSLSGSAAKIIEAIDISEDNYVIAWDLLKKKYDDERGIKRRHIQCLIDELPRIKQESASAIQELVDHIQKHIRVLQSMKLPTDSWGDLLIYVIEKNLDNVTRRRWEEHIESKDDVTTTTMMEFLQRQSQLLRRSATDGSINGARTEVSEKEASNKQRGSTTKSRGKATLATTTQEKKCYLCQGQHLLYSCKKFLSLAVDDRIKEIKRLKLCLNCLRSDHYSRSCRYGSCKECGERHNTLCHLRGQTRNPPTKPPRSPTENPEEASTGTTLCSMTDAVRRAALATSNRRVITAESTSVSES